jgi:hypothetical protein
MFGGISMRVYHFLTQQYAIDDLAKRRLKVARLDDLNDPFELAALELSDREMRRAYRGFARQMAKKFGVICFSRGWHNPVLWSHYAEKHKGVCLGFDIPDAAVLPVTYMGARLPNKIKAELVHGRLDDQDMRQIFTTKFKDWEYENEVRIFLRLVDRDADTGLYFQDFSESLALREVILGPRCALTKTAIQRQLAGRGEIRVIKSRLAFKTFRVVENQAVS